MHLAETFDIPKISVRIDCTDQKLMPTSLAMLRGTRLLLRNQGVHYLDIFISGDIFGAAGLSIILNALSPPLKLCCPFLHCAIRKRLLPKGFHESKKEGKDQESLQSSTTPYPGYQWKSKNFTIRHHKREPRGQPFPGYIFLGGIPFL